MQLIQFMAVVQVVFSWPLLLSPLLNPGLLYVALDERQQNKHTCICVHQVIHGDLALRNIMVHSFPSEVKLTEFGLARDLTYMRSRRGIRKGVDKVRRTVRVQRKAPRDAIYGALTTTTELRCCGFNHE